MSKHDETTSLHLSLLMEGSLMAPRAQQEASWFGRSQHDKHNKQTNNQPSLKDRWWGYRKSHELGVTIEEDI